MIPFLIIALPRTGSSMLQHVFAELRGVPFIREPFNRDEWPGLHPPSIRGVPDLRDRLRILAASGAAYGIKHVHDPLHWNLGKPEGWELLQTLCRLPGCRIVFLYRGNVLRQFLSLEIARQTGNWSITTEAAVPQRAGTVRQTGTVPWTDAQVEWALELLQRTNERIFSELTQSGARFVSYAYETLFGEHVLSGAGAFNRIAEHFGLAPFTGEEARLEAALAQGNRQDALSSLYRESEDFRRLNGLFGQRFGSAYEP